jgi:uncharacterized protein YndB with AHSA1/START domain
MVAGSKELTVTMPSDVEVAVSRIFDAPRELVFDALTKPEIIMRWLWGPDEWRMIDCQVDLRVGGSIRYVWRNPDGSEMALSGTFREITPPDRIVHTELFDDDWTGGETLVTSELTEAAGQTTLTMTVLYASQEARDAAVATGMNEGMAIAYNRLDAYLEEVA